MRVFDLEEMVPEVKANVFYDVDEFSSRLIKLPPGAEIPSCEMETYVLFYVISGEIKVTVDEEQEKLEEQKCLVTDPATLSMKSDEGAKILGVQIEKKG
ncbi:hypothetical protein AKJ36_02275 [candidate division MSBL1 archaeon SCGC-AAA259I07]|uniref:Cupin type-2 domain-containing protein n=1 Tax=candidate division MSBL1 archaeon SCGC-AAA259I07 TaxID=1698266 RepID=A0A133UKN9_9EURY|nr:hypothetical protein AKJ36_02275 [candidate division MSBL1 archaeon SCGC-AAA259I07]